MHAFSSLKWSALRRNVSLTIAGLALAGCDTGINSVLPLRVNNEPPLFKQEEEVTLIKPFRIKIEKCYWAAEFQKPGFDKLPERFREEHRDQFIVKPQHAFLVVEFSVLNPTAQPLTWSTAKPISFGLKNSQGKQYASVGQDVNMEDLTAKMILGSGNINPDTALSGKKVFDVPKDDYILHVMSTSYQGGWQYAQTSTIWRWSLSPTEGK
jgi:hypothetical protein